jgi:hypothetical protein
MAGSKISLSEASSMTEKFRIKFPNESMAYMYSTEVFQSILTQENCVGLRIYNGIDENGHLQTVLVGVDEEGNDLFNGEIYDRSLVCPPKCATSNPLNS